MQQPSNEKGPPIGQLHKTTPPGTEENPINVDKFRHGNDKTPLPQRLEFCTEQDQDQVVTLVLNVSDQGTRVENVSGQDRLSANNVAKQDV